MADGIKYYDVRRHRRTYFEPWLGHASLLSLTGGIDASLSNIPLTHRNAELCHAPNEYYDALGVFRAPVQGNFGLLKCKQKKRGLFSPRVLLGFLRILCYARLMAGCFRVRISHAAMFVEVETFNLTFLGDAQGAGGFHRIHEDHRGHKHAYADGRIASTWAMN
jgi:hypothetical protein